MTEPWGQLRRILFLQRRDLLESQAPLVGAWLQAALPGVRVDAAGSAAEVAPGTEYDAVVTPTLDWLPQALHRLQGYRWIHFLSAGVERIWDMPFDKDGILLTKSSGVHGDMIGDYVLAAVLYFAKSFDRFVEQSRARSWQRSWLDGLKGRTAMILGMGHVGSAIAARLAVLGVQVIGVQRRPRGADALTPAEAHMHLPSVDFLIVCLPLTEDTLGMVGQAILGQLKPGAVLVDVSRGGVVSERAVVEALDSGRLRGAALDVFETEPLPPESELWSRSNVLITPHVAGTGPEYLERAIDVFLQNARALEAGEPTPTAVDPASGY